MRIIIRFIIFIYSSVILLSQTSPTVRVNSISALTNLAVPFSTGVGNLFSAIVSGSAGVGDGNGGVWCWNPNDATATNGTNVLASATGTGRWRLATGNAYSSTPSGSAGGVLSGTYPNPNLASGLILTNFTYTGGNFFAQTNTDLTASRAVISGSDKTFQSSATTSTELGYVSGVTSPIQTQLNNRVTATPVIAQNNVPKIDASGLNLIASSITETNGNVGILTPSPGNLLTVNGRAGFNNDKITIGGTSGLAAERGYINYDGTTATLRITGAANVGLGFGINGFVDKVVIDANGNVGILTPSPFSTLQVNGSIATALSSGGSATLGISHSTYLVASSAQTITLPTSVGITGRKYTIKLTAAGTGTVATTGGQTIDGSATYSLSAQYKYVTVQSDGANWFIIANN